MVAKGAGGDEQTLAALTAGAATRPRLSRRAWLLVAFGGILVAKLVLAQRLELLPVEAYSWVWAQHPQLGYFDHPAMTSWIVRASTSLLGHSFIGVRLQGARRMTAYTAK